jgi:putative tryptophan/tyrosine transport system substrate-binding protein
MQEATMTRRIIELVISLAFVLCVASLVADAQPSAKVARIGYLAQIARAPLVEAFRQGLRELGYREGQNLAIEFRDAEGKPERLPALAAELVQLHVDVIVTHPTNAARAAKHATTLIPIVMAGADDPVRTGLVASLARPGGNITGVSSFGPDLSGKRLELLKEAVPTLSRIAVLWNAADSGMTLRFEQMQAAALALGETVYPLGVHDATQVESALTAMTQERPDALFVITDVLTARHWGRIVEFAAQHQLPTLFEYREPVVAGGLIAYGPSQADLHRRAAYYVDRILKGTRPADLPVEQPMKMELVLNLKTAEALGLTIPPTLLFQADEVLK